MLWKIISVNKCLEIWDALTWISCFKCIFSFVWKMDFHHLILSQATFHTFYLPKLTSALLMVDRWLIFLCYPFVVLHTQCFLQFKALLITSCTFSADGRKLAVLFSMKILSHLNAVLVSASASARSVVIGFSIRIWKLPIAFMATS